MGAGDPNMPMGAAPHGPTAGGGVPEESFWDRKPVWGRSSGRTPFQRGRGSTATRGGQLWDASLKMHQRVEGVWGCFTTSSKKWSRNQASSWSWKLGVLEEQGVDAHPGYRAEVQGEAQARGPWVRVWLQRLLGCAGRETVSKWWSLEPAVWLPVPPDHST